jgi:hypothetical protein
MTDKSRISDLDLERLVAGEAGASESATLKQRLQEEPGGMARLARLESSNQEILERLPPGDVTREVKRRLAETNWQEKKATAHAPRWWLVAPALTAAAVFLVWAGPFSSPAFDGQVPQVWQGGIEEGRIKGLDPSLAIYRKSGESQQRLDSGATAHQGDLLQLGYVAGGHKFGAIVSLDGAGNWTLHHPARSDLPPLLATEGEVLLDHSYELDAAPRFERFFFVVGADAFDVKGLLERLKSQQASLSGGAMPELPEAHAVVAFDLKKEMP